MHPFSQIDPTLLISFLSFLKIQIINKNKLALRDIIYMGVSLGLVSDKPCGFLVSGSKKEITSK